ncbi:EF-hand calcium-binding domain-containing protein 6-like [Lytechinus pictus]|uniref:EF-hand calcium-binding domain-containing protein 6-like n=1 Tax=Lytechinus pictus TaxID=7653 RepID=UPI0030BA16E8
MSQALVSRPSSQAGFPRQPGLPNLPEIQHPLARLGDPDKLNVRGLSSRSGGRPLSNPLGGRGPRPAEEVPFSSLTPRVSRTASGGRPPSQLQRGEFGPSHTSRSLPKIPHLYSSIPEGVEVYHSDDPSKTRLPVFGARSSLESRAEGRDQLTSRQSNRPGTQSRIEVDEIEMKLREKVKKNYYELKKLFISNDPEGRGIVSREALARIVVTFLGRFVSLKQFNQLMQRMRLEDKKAIKLEEFYAFFRHETSNEMPAWLDPINRHKSDKLVMSAAQVHAQLKERAKQRFLDIADMIPQLNPGGTGRILKPEFRNALNKMLFHMDDDEFEKLWLKYDSDNIGVVNGGKLLGKLGINLRATTAPVRDIYARSTDGEPTSPRRKKKADTARLRSIHVEKWIKDKFRTGCTRMRREFEEFDKDNKGEVDKEKFGQVLSKFGLKLEGPYLDEFLTRCGLTANRAGMVSYRDFLRRFQDRSEGGVTHNILNDPTHKYHQGDWMENQKNVNSMTSAEVRMMELFQGDFIGLLGIFQKCDKLCLRVISQQEFRAAIESKFSLGLSDREFEAFLDRVPLDEEGNVKYHDFLGQFDTKYGPAPSLFDSKTVRGGPEDMDLDLEEDLSQEEEQPQSFQNFKKGRSMRQISKMMKQLITNRMAEVEAVFSEIDVNNTRRLSQEMMYELLKRLNIRPEVTRGEIRRLWDSLITTQNRTLHFTEFVRHFGYSLKSAAFPNAKLSPPKRGDSDFLIRSRKLNCAADMLEDNLRSKVDYMWDDLRKEFLNLDTYGTGFVSKEEFRDLLQELCVHLNSYELDMLSEKFDTQKDNRVSYVEFLRPFAVRKSTHRYGNNMMGLMAHPQAEMPIDAIVDEPNKGLSGITARLRQKLVGDWRNLRRAFKRLDTERTGYLTMPEFRNVLRLANMVLDEEEVYQVMSQFDEKMEGKINYNKFISETFNADPNKP